MLPDGSTCASIRKKRTSRRGNPPCFAFRKQLLAQRGNAYIGLAARLLAELDRTVDQREERVVLAHADVLARIVYRTALTNDDVTCLCELTAEQFHAESLAFRLTAVLRTTYTFLVCHFSSVFKGLCNNLLYEHLRQILAVSVALLVSRSALLLEDEDLVVLQVLQNLALYRGAFYYRCAYLDLTVVVCEQDLVETYGRVFFALETVNIKFPTFLSFELLTCNLYYNVH